MPLAQPYNRMPGVILIDITLSYMATQLARAPYNYSRPNVGRNFNEDDFNSFTWNFPDDTVHPSWSDILANYQAAWNATDEATLEGKLPAIAMMRQAYLDDYVIEVLEPHSLKQVDWAQASSGALDFIKNKPSIPSISTQTHINDAATNAATNAPTNLNVVTTLLGALTGEVNATNTKQNDLATKYNDLATKFNNLLDKLEANAILAA